MFRSRKGGALCQRQVLRIVRTAAARAGLQAKVSPHWLRHGHATHALERGAPVHLVATTLGHASIATTGKYAHPPRPRADGRRIGDEQLVHALAAGEILEDYPADPLSPSALVLGHASNGTPLHAVCAFDPSGTLLVIIAYVPEPPHWLDERTRGPGQSPRW